MNADDSLTQPDASMLRQLIHKLRKPESLELISEREDELFKKAGLRGKARKQHSIYAGDPDLGFGAFDANYGAWIRRGSILVTCDVNGNNNLYVLSPHSVGDLTAAGGEPHTREGRAIYVTNEPGPWWARLREEIPKIVRGFAELQRLADQAADELTKANARNAAAARQRDLGEARAVYGNSGRTGCVVIMLTLVALASAAVPLFR